MESDRVFIGENRMVGIKSSDTPSPLKADKIYFISPSEHKPYGINTDGLLFCMDSYCSFVSNGLYSTRGNSIKVGSSISTSSIATVISRLLNVAHNNIRIITDIDEFSKSEIASQVHNFWGEIEREFSYILVNEDGLAIITDQNEFIKVAIDGYN